MMNQSFRRIYFCMKKRKLFLFCLFYSLHSLAQSQIFIDQPYNGMPSYTANTREITQISELPTKIQYIIDQTLSISLFEFDGEYRFAGGQIVDLEGWLENDSVAQTDYHLVIPKYNLNFELSDTSVGIKSYCFQLNLDPFGQIVDFEWMRDSVKKSELMSPPQIISIATKYAKKKKYKTKEYIVRLGHYKEYDRLCWDISFLQSKEGNSANGSKAYKTIRVDWILGIVWLELDMGEVWSSCNSY